MSMLEKMARRLALDALERVQPDTFTNVIDTIDLTKNEDGNYQVGEHISYGDKSAPWLDYDAARDTMVAMMAAQAGALVVVPEEAPGDPYLAQIAQLLVDSADVPTDASDVADGAAIVGTVKNALAYLDAARHDNGLKRATILEMGGHLNTINTMLAKSPDMPLTKDDLQLWPQTVAGVADALRYLNDVRGACVANESEIERLNAVISNWHIGTNELQDKYLAAQQEIGALTAKLDEARRSIKRNVDEAANCQARYEAMCEALGMAMDKLAGVGK